MLKLIISKIIFIIFCCVCVWVYLNYIYNEDIDYVLIVVSFLILETIFFLEIFFTSKTHDFFKLFFGDKLSYFLFFILFMFYCIQVIISICYIILEREEDVYWQANISYLIDSFFFFFFKELKKVSKIKRNGWSTFWFFLQYSRSLRTRTNIFLRLMSFFYIFISILIAILIVVIILWFFCIDYPYYFFWFKFFLRVFFWYVIVFYFMHYIFLSFFFTNLDFRSFFSFFTWNYGFTIDFLDTYLISKSFISIRESKNKSNSLKFNPLYLSTRFLGAHYYVKKNKSWNRYWFTTKTMYFWRRYYISCLWVDVNNVVFDEMVFTDYYRFKCFLKFYWYIFIEGSLFVYLFGDKQRVSDKRNLSLSRFYDHNLQNNFFLK